MYYPKKNFPKKRYRVIVRKDGEKFKVEVDRCCICDSDTYNKINSKIIEQYQSYDLVSQKGWITIYV